MGDPDDLDLNRPKPPEEAPSETEFERQAESGLDRGALFEPEGEAEAEPRPGTAREPFPIGLAAAGAGLLGLVVALGYLVWRPARAPQKQPSPTVAPTAAATRAPEAPAPSATPESVVLPPLDQSDALVRDLAGGLSSHPQLAAWLANPDLVRRFTAAVANVAAGENPRVHLLFLAPREKFRVLARDGRVLIDPAGYARYDAVVDGLAALDADRCGHAYRLLAPLVEAAYRELGHPEGGFDAALSDAVAALLAVPVLEGDVAVRPVTRAVVLYPYADPRLESLSAPQKQLLRTGPRNVRRVQAKLRELAPALGLRLPTRP